MAFDLTGYERDDSYTMSSFFIYSLISVVILVLITIALGFYFFIEHDKLYTKIVLEDEVDNAVHYENTQNNTLNSSGEFVLDDGTKIRRIAIGEAIDKAVEFYNE